jgi:hypothetical protein
VRYRLGVVVLAAGWSALGGGSSVARADGGALRFSERRGDTFVAVFTSPTPPRAGLVDVSVLVQEAQSGRPLRAVPIVVHAHPAGDGRRSTSAQATTEAATNKLFQAAQLNFWEAGRWHVDVELDVPGFGQGAPIGFDMEVAAAPPPWLALGLWIGWPVVPIALFVVHRWRVERRRLPLVRFVVYSGVY